MKKNILSLLFSLLLAITTNAQTWNCGDDGDNLTATLSGGILTVGGIGEMANYSSVHVNHYPNGTSSPWNEYRHLINRIVIGDSVTLVGDWAFGYSAVTSVLIGSNVVSIGAHAFQNCSGVTSVTIGNRKNLLN
jgi:hypothetical protein